MALVKTVQWNIGGGKIHHPGADPKSAQSYTEDGLEKIIDTLEQQAADIITLQETHARGSHSQVEDIAGALDLPYWANDVYAISHIDDQFMLGQGIISRFPIHKHSFRLFRNPGFSAVLGDKVVDCHDKGVTSVDLYLDIGAKLLAQTLHAVPFSAFGVEESSVEAERALADMQEKILKQDGCPRLLQGDFNLDTPSLRERLPKLFDAGFDEIKQWKVTTPRGRVYDHVLFSGMKAVETNVLLDQPTDHFPIVTTLLRY